MQKVSEKIKVTSLEIVVNGTKEKPYFEIKYKEVGKEDYSIGYSSYDLNNVLDWKEECFEIVNQVAEEYEQEVGVAKNATTNDDLISKSALVKALTNVEVSFYLEDGQTSDTYDGTTIMDIIEEQPTVSVDDGWILCNERLPDKEGTYLVTLKSFKTITFADFKDVKHNPHFNANKVIAWRELPQPYVKGD